MDQVRAREGGRLASFIVRKSLSREQRGACERSEEARILKTSERQKGKEQELMSVGLKRPVQ